MVATGEGIEFGIAQPGRATERNMVVQLVGAVRKVGDAQNDCLAQARIQHFGVGDRAPELSLSLEQRHRGVRTDAHDVQRKARQRLLNDFGQLGDFGKGYALHRL